MLSILALRSNGISVLTPLLNLTHLKLLDLEQNQINDLGPLVNMLALEELRLSGNQLTTIGVASGLPNLRRLYLNSNNISQLDKFDAPPQLEELYIESNGITKLKNFSAEGLQVLDLSLNTIAGTEWTNLGSVSSLRELYVRTTGLTVPGTIPALPLLEILDASLNNFAKDPKLGYVAVNTRDVAGLGMLVKQASGSPAYRRQTPLTGGQGAFYSRFWNPDTLMSCQQPPWASLIAVNANTGEVAWRVPLGEYEELTKKGVAKTGVPNAGAPIEIGRAHV